MEEGDKTFIIDTEKIKTNYKIVTKKEKKPFIKVDIIVNGRIEEALFSIKNNDLNEYEKIAKKVINHDILQMLVTLQKANVDPIGFGLHYRSRHFNKDDWEVWKDLYPKLSFKVHTDIQIEDTGLIE
jgi:spore germination protein KC